MHLASNHFRGSSRKPSSTEFAEAKRRKWFIAAKQDQGRKEKQEDQAEQSALDLIAAVEIAIATETQISVFHEKLDKYDEATIRALIENREALEAVTATLNDMLSQAHQLEDGRRVFKTQDGLKVFDEFGEELDQDTIHPDMIADERPRWESFKQQLDLKTSLEAQQDALIDYQQKLDDAREQSSQDGFTVEELESLEAELEADMPQSVAQFLPAEMQPAATPTMKSDYETVAAENNWYYLSSWIVTSR